MFLTDENEGNYHKSQLASSSTSLVTSPHGSWWECLTRWWRLINGTARLMTTQDTAWCILSQSPEVEHRNEKCSKCWNECWAPRLATFVHPNDERDYCRSNVALNHGIDIPKKFKLWWAGRNSRARLLDDYRKPPEFAEYEQAALRAFPMFQFAEWNMSVVTNVADDFPSAGVTEFADASPER